MEDGLARLCQACGLCCDGSLFGRVDLEPDEVERARKHRLPLASTGRSFEQPCTALGETRRCSVYEDRPAACRRFICQLYARVRDDGIDLDGALGIAEKTRALLARVDRAGPTDPELTRYLTDDFARAVEGARPREPAANDAGVRTASAPSASASTNAKATRPRARTKA